MTSAHHLALHLLSFSIFLDHSKFILFKWSESHCTLSCKRVISFFLYAAKWILFFACYNELWTCDKQYSIFVCNHFIINDDRHHDTTFVYFDFNSSELVSCFHIRIKVKAQKHRKRVLNRVKERARWKMLFNGSSCGNHARHGKKNLLPLHIRYNNS